MLFARHRTACGTASRHKAVLLPRRQRYMSIFPFRPARPAFGATGRVAKECVIAHEIGTTCESHRTESELRRRRARSQGRRTRCRWRWAAGRCTPACGRTPGQGRYLDPGDIDEGLDAAAAGATIACRKNHRPSNPTRQAGIVGGTRTWFRRGLDTGEPNQCELCGTSLLACGWACRAGDDAALRRTNGYDANDRWPSPEFSVARACCRCATEPHTPSAYGTDTILGSTVRQGSCTSSAVGGVAAWALLRREHEQLDLRHIT